ncbi:MAG: hemerythrin domain-containing protein [Ignavibacteriaceae bacterium]|nr:hemerythrin domain-containing protein [Ignavibacteriaceae bacterium]
MPLKRHTNLAPLSRDHMKGLFLSRYAQKNAPPYKNFPVDTPSKTAIIIDGFVNELLPHFRREEDILLPFIKEFAPGLVELADEIFAGHKLLEVLAEKMKSDPGSADLLDEFGRVLEGHIRKEERILFEKLQEEAGEEKMKGLEL